VLIIEGDLGSKGHEIWLDWSRIGRAPWSGTPPPPYEKKSLKKGRTSGGSAEEIRKYFFYSNMESYFDIT
jgi:hypothetical protein